jgi:hypothetical protein
VVDGGDHCSFRCAGRCCLTAVSGSSWIWVRRRATDSFACVKW